MIYVKLTGGLGNQMFQYATARWVQEITGQELCLDYSDLEDYQANHNATFENTLGNMAIKYDKLIVSKDEFVLQNPEFSKEYYSLYKKLMFISRTLFFEGRIFFERKYQNKWNKRGLFFARDAFIPIFPENVANKDIVLSGFFQSEKYFPHMREMLLQEFKVTKSISGSNEKWLDKIENVNSVCLHVRRGDYALKGRMHCSVAYYQKAITYISNRLENPEFFVFSDDIEWVRENIRLEDIKVKFVNENNNCYDEIRLMYNCKHFILSNSSFSWWAQYLSDNKNKVVVAPRPWFRRIPTDIYMNEWVTIPVYE